MAKKKITLKLDNQEYLDLLKIISIGEFAMYGHKISENDEIFQLMSSIYKYAEDFNCEDLVRGPLSIDNSYEVDTGFMSDLINETFDIGKIPGEEDIRFMLKSSE
ncbi:MAG: hypothetical protein PHW82_05655 [Bacteroidales bacterium]|nr:hypothetical protein [Bacteroidales bacterium]